MDAFERALMHGVSAVLSFRREELRFTQAQVAEQAGVSEHYVGLLERAERMPSVKTLAMLAYAMGVTVGDFFVGGKPKEAPETRRLLALARAVPPASRAAVAEMLRGVVEAHRRERRIRAARARRREESIDSPAPRSRDAA